jgi:transposase-like protein
MKFTIKDFRKKYPDNDSCLNELMKLRFGTLSVCPECEKNTKFHRASKKRQCFECQWCGYQVYPMKGTIFEKTTTPLSDWFYVIYLMTATRSGVSAKEVERQLGVTYKCAWRMCHQIRLLMGGNGDRKLNGHVEADETYNGGVRKGKRGRGAEGKTPVFGMVEREGEIRAEVVENVRTVTLMPVLERHVEKGTYVSTDELSSYNKLANNGYDHGTVNHSAKQYVNGIDHTNTIEGFWSRLKLSIRGTHVHVSAKHLQKYVDEFAFRYNNRDNASAMFDVVLSGVQPA